MNADQLPWRMAESGVDFEIQDPGNGKTIAGVKHGGVVPLVLTSAGQTRALANPVKAGLDLSICVKTLSGSGTTTVTGLFWDEASSGVARTTITFDATTTATTAKFINLKSMWIGTTLRWVRIAGSAAMS